MDIGRKNMRVMRVIENRNTHHTGQASHLIPVISDFGQVIVIKWPTDRVTIPEPGDPGNESGDQRATENPINVTGNTFHITPSRWRESDSSPARAPSANLMSKRNL